MPLPGIAMSAGYRANPVTATFAAQTNNSTDLTTYTFSAHSIGTAAADRIVVVAVQGGAVATPRSVSSVTIGGNAATLFATQSDNTHRARVALAYLLVPTGTTADIVVVWSGAMEQCCIAVWALTGGTSAPHDVRFDTTGAAVSTAALIVPQGAAVVAAAIMIDTTAGYTGIDWVGASESSDIAGEAGNLRHGAANSSSQTVSTVLTVSATGNLDNDLGSAGVFASFLGA